MMSKNDTRIILEDQKNDFLYDNNKSNLNITFNRVAFIFFVFFVISCIYSIHLIHLGSRKATTQKNETNRINAQNLLGLSDDGNTTDYGGPSFRTLLPKK